MPLLSFTAQDYLGQFQRLLPRGRVWHRGLQMVQDADLLALMPTWSRLQDALNTLIAEIFPCSTVELLPEWEVTLGLPDPCIGPLDTIAQRQAAVCTKFVARGGQSKDYFIAIAAKLGYVITITEFAPFRCGINRAGDPLNSADWAFTWRVNATLTSPIQYFEVSVQTAGDALAWWGDKLLECMLNALKPAHTVLIFGYAQPGTEPQYLLMDDGSIALDDRGNPILAQLY
jgi:uncharacterized protein YmfQ (DUF2313 family)